MTTFNNNLHWHEALTSRADRQIQNVHRSVILWFSGLSGAGKSTLAHAVERRLHELDCRTYVLDGDNVRHALCSDLGFSAVDRSENIRRVGEVAKLFIDAGMIVLTAFISPYRADRARVRAMVSPEDFVEIYCRCTLETCEKRDVKGIYAKARQGAVKEFTGISSPYEVPENPELVVDTGSHSLESCVNSVLLHMRERGAISHAV
jgi:adenylylsulfate kinase